MLLFDPFNYCTTFPRPPGNTLRRDLLGGHCLGHRGYRGHRFRVCLGVGEFLDRANLEAAVVIGDNG
jgi:hypothetical protein